MNLDFNKNLGNTDRIIRAATGLVLMTLVFTKVLKGWQAILATIISICQFFDAIFSYCILYDILGCSTNHHFAKNK